MRFFYLLSPLDALRLWGCCLARGWQFFKIWLDYCHLLHTNVLNLMEKKNEN
jgi:hypothetical protein